MKTNLLLCGVVLGLLAGSNAVAQSPSLVSPVILQVNEIDTFNLLAFPRTKKAMDGAVLVLPLKGFGESEVEALVQNSELLNRPVWIMDGAKLITDQRSADFFWHNRVTGRDERRLALQFASLEEAQAMANRLYFQPGLEALIQHYKAGLDDQRFWLCNPMVEGGGFLIK